MEKMLITLIVLTAAIYLVRQLFVSSGSVHCSGCAQKDGCCTKDGCAQKDSCCTKDGCAQKDSCCSCSMPEENVSDLPQDADKPHD